MMEYYSVIKGNELLLHAITWMNLNSLSEERDKKFRINCMILYIKILEYVS